MQISKKTKIIIIVTVSVLVLSAVIWYVLNSQKLLNQNDLEGLDQVATSTPEKTFQEDLESNFKNIQPNFSNDQVPIVVAARRFAERLGSYSVNNRDVDALGEVNPLVTAKAKKMASDYYNSLLNIEGFWSVSAKAMTVNNIKINDDQASLDVFLISQEFNQQGYQTRQYQTKLGLTIIKVGEDWLIDSFNW